MATEVVHLPNGSDPTVGYSSFGALLAAVAASGWFPYHPAADVGHSSGISAWRLTGWTGFAASGSEAAYIQVAYQDPGATANILQRRFHFQPGALSGADPGQFLRDQVGLMTSVPAWNPAAGFTSAWASGLGDQLKAVGGSWDNPIAYAENGPVNATEGALAGKTIVWRLDASYDPSAGEQASGRTQVAGYADFYVVSDLDDQRVIGSGAALGSVVVNTPQVILGPGGATDAWGDWADGQGEIEGTLNGIEGILGTTLDQVSELEADARLTRLTNRFSPLLMPVEDATPASAVDEDVASEMAARLAALPSLDGNDLEAPPSLKIAGGFLVPLATTPALIETISTVPAMAVAAVTGVAVAARSLISWLAGEGGIATAAAANAAANATQASHLGRIADAMEELNTNVVSLGEKLDILLTTTQTLELKVHGIKATARPGAIELEE